MKKIASFFLALVLCVGLAIPASAVGFSDVPEDYWAKEAINRAVSDGVVGGYPDGRFRPASAVSYGAFSLMLARAFYSGELVAYPNGGTGAGEAIMNRHNILNDTSRASRSGGAELPREDMAQCMYNLLVDLGTAIPSDTEYLKAMGSMSDFYSISPNCRRAVMVCYTLGLLGGLSDGSFGPQKSMNRAQAAVVIGRLRDYVQSNGGAAGVVEIPSGPEPKAPPQAEAAPEIKELPAFKLMDGENVQQMMDRLNAATPAYTAGYLSNGKAITEENIKDLLAELKESMPDDSPWYGEDEAGTYLYWSPKFSSYFGYAYGCNSFGAAVSDAIFGEDAPLTRHQNFDQIKIGDVIWVKSASGTGHVSVITSLTNPGWGPGVYSACGGGGTRGVSWDERVKDSTLAKPEYASTTWVYSRY